MIAIQIAHFEADLKAYGFINDAEIEDIRAQVEREIADAIEFAKNSPAPDLTNLTRDVYTDDI